MPHVPALRVPASRLSGIPPTGVEGSLSFSLHERDTEAEYPRREWGLLTSSLHCETHDLAGPQLTSPATAFHGYIGPSILFIPQSRHWIDRGCPARRNQARPNGDKCNASDRANQCQRI